MSSEGLKDNFKRITLFLRVCDSVLFDVMSLSHLPKTTLCALGERPNDLVVKQFEKGKVLLQTYWMGLGGADPITSSAVMVRSSLV